MGHSSTSLFLSAAFVLLFAAHTIPADHPLLYTSNEHSLTADSGPVKLGKLKLRSIGPVAIEFEMDAEVIDVPRDGRVDRIVFDGFTVNGVPFEVDEHIAKFDVRKGTSARLPQPLRCRISTTGAGKTLVADLIRPKDKWDVRGNVTIHASASRLGIRFRRKMSMPVSVTLENPLPFR
jgi:hypothetical protein